eukprot:13669628-Ditylum_brightwellii.AAC.1
MSVCVDRADRNSDGNIALNADGTERVISETITQQSKLEKECMKEVDRQSRMLEEIPPMVSPLVDYLSYTGITDYAYQILQGATEKLD